MQKNASMFLVGPPPGRRKRLPGFLVCALYTWWMLRKTWGVITFVQLVHMVDATQDMGWGGVTFV